jgi:hypothetical protein
MRLGDWVIVAILLGLCGVVVAQHLDHGDADVPRVPPIVLGEALDTSVVLTDLEGKERTIADDVGSKATVLYSWKVSCPCIDVCEPRLRPLFARYGKARGVAWIAIDGEPEDTREEVLAKMGRLGSPYKMLFDPDQQVLARLGFDQAALVAVLDGNGRLRYRGSMDDDYLEPKRSYLEEALRAVVEGGDLAVAETPAIYGCEFSRPPACTEPVRRAPGASPPGS